VKIAVLGGGSWGTALANVLAHKGEEVWLWARSEEVVGEIRETGTNVRYLPGLVLSRNLRANTDLPQVMEGTSCAVLAVPCQHLALFLRQHRDHFPAGTSLVCASKGVELGTFRTMGQVVAEELAGLEPRYAVLSGPSFASEVVRGMPTAVALGCADPDLGNLVQALFSTESFRVYVNTDVLGVELGGAVKNIMASASGISDGLGFGENARAALITRGLSEMSRLGAALGARPATFMGLSGMGDLVLTCTGDLSRNRRVGLAIGRGQSLDAVLGGMHNVAEGVKTTQAVHFLGLERNIDLPITVQVHSVLFEGRDPARAVRELMTRPLKEE
jgi:glycerol-3-phosphate dehydrogenase (NAD(P)+)